MRKSAAIAQTDRPAGYARYVGRVGGLAFALGVGAAMLTGGGVALANTTDSPGGSSQSTSASSSPTSAQESSVDRGAEASASESTPDPESGAESPSDADVESADESESAEIEAAEVESAEIEAAEAAEIEAAEAAEISESDGADEATAVNEAEGADGATTVNEADGAAQGDLAPPAEIQPNAQSGRRVSVAAPAAADTSPESAAAAATSAGVFQSFFANQTPTLAHDPGENTVVDGRIEGTLNPEDPDSARLTYTATTPAHGTVTINSDGTFVYTPGASYAGQDRFDVTVTDADSGFHIHGFAGLLNLLTFGLFGSSGHRTTESVFIGFDRAVVASGLNSPVDFRFLPDGRVIVAEKGGAIRIVENGAAGDPLVTLSVNTLGERGISGLAIDPDYADNGYLYVAYTTAALRNRLSRLSVVGNTAGSELVLLQSTESAALNHQGGALGFGSDGKLYWGLGDNGSGANSQNLTNLHGKILRINPDGSTPSDNPSLGEDALPQIYAYGLRNPFRLAFTPDGGLLVADVGAASFEEVNLVTAGGNYGWPGAEGVCAGCTSVNPIYTYPRGSGAAITSVLVYDGETFGPAYLDKVFIADLVQGWIKVLTCTPEFTTCGDPQDFDLDAGTTLVLAQGPDGNVYQMTYQPGEIVRIAPAGSSAST